jgi:hypothetical protein
MRRVVRMPRHARLITAEVTIGNRKEADCRNDQDRREIVLRPATSGKRRLELQSSSPVTIRAQPF